MNFEFFLSFRSVTQCLNFPLFRTLKNYFLCVKIFFEIPKFVLGTSPFKLIYSILKISSYVLNNNFSYIQTFFVFFLQKTSYFNHDDIDAFSFFFFKNFFFEICLGPFFCLFFFSPSQIFWHLSRAFFSKLFFFWWYLLSNFIYVY